MHFTIKSCCGKIIVNLNYNDWNIRIVSIFDTFGNNGKKNVVKVEETLTGQMLAMIQQPLQSSVYNIGSVCNREEWSIL